jgi:hypothetical protein
MMHSHFAPPPKTHAPVKPRPDTVRTFRSDNPATATPESFRDVVRQDPWPLTAKDTAEIQRIALTYLKADSNYVRTVDRRPLQIRGDTALATFFYGAEVTFVRLARRQGTWVPTYRGSGIK